MHSKKHKKTRLLFNAIHTFFEQNPKQKYSAGRWKTLICNRPYMLDKNRSRTHSHKKTAHLHRCQWHLTRQNAQRDTEMGLLWGAAYTHTQAASLCHTNVSHTLKLNRLLLWKARGPCDMRVGGEVWEGREVKGLCSDNNPSPTRQETGSLKLSTETNRRTNV